MRKSRVRPLTQAEIIARAPDIAPSGRLGALMQAATLVASSIKNLDRHTEPCECCGLIKQRNRIEFQLGVELEAIHRKLLRFSGQIIEG